jgi:membrane associated rhomboid family serine protease
MKYLFVLVFIFVLTAFDKSIGYTDISPWWTHLTYMFQHTGILHLIVNSLAFIGMFRILEKIVDKYVLLAAILSIGFIASFLSMYKIPTLGISGAVYAMPGIYFALVRVKRLTVIDRKKFYLFVFSVILCLSFSFFNPHSNFRLHVFSTIMGYVFGLTLERWK